MFERTVLGIVTIQQLEREHRKLTELEQKLADPTLYEDVNKGFLAKLLHEQGEAVVLDVRGSNEYREGHVPGALHIPLGYLEERIDEVPQDRPLLVHCLSGFRSSIATSILHAHGRTGTMNLTGGWQAWSAAGNPIERGVKEEAVAS